MVGSIDGRTWLGAQGKTYTTVEDAKASFRLDYGWAPPSPPIRVPRDFRKLRVFLCHAHEDKPLIRKLSHRLSNSGLDPWLDEEKLIPGKKWKDEISKAIRNADSVLVCLSNVAVTKTGYLNREMREALDRADEQPDGKIFIIPLRLDPCEVPERFKDIQWVDCFRDDSYNKLMMSFKDLASWLNNAGHKVIVPNIA